MAAFPGAPDAPTTATLRPTDVPGRIVPAYLWLSATDCVLRVWLDDGDGWRFVSPSGWLGGACRYQPEAT